jgi:hypothetical protein
MSASPVREPVMASVGMNRRSSRSTDATAIPARKVASPDCRRALGGRGSVASSASRASRRTSRSRRARSYSRFLGSTGQKLLSNRLKRSGVTSTRCSYASAPSSPPVRRPTSPRIILIEEDPARPPVSEGPRSGAATAAARPSGNPRAGEMAEAGCRRSSNPQAGETAEAGRRRRSCDGLKMSLRLGSRPALGARFTWRATMAADVSGGMAEADRRRRGCDGLEMSLSLDSRSALGVRFTWRATTAADASDDPRSGELGRRSSSPQAGSMATAPADASDDPQAGEIAEAGRRGSACDRPVTSSRPESRSALGARYT